MSNRRKQLLASAAALLLVFCAHSAFARSWTLVETRRVVHADTSSAPAEWKVAKGSAAALKTWTTTDEKKISISATCSWSGIPGRFKAGAAIPLSVRIEQMQNTETGYDSSLKLYAGEEGGSEGDGPDVLAGWREGVVSYAAKGSVTAPRGSNRRFYLRAQCKVAGDSHDTYYFYRYAANTSASPKAAPPVPAVSGWGGQWKTSLGDMRLTQTGQRASGKYDFKGGHIEGVIKGDELRGRWTQDNGSGHFVFRLSADGQQFKGEWGRGKSESGGGDWSGSR